MSLEKFYACFLLLIIHVAEEPIESSRIGDLFMCGSFIPNKHKGSQKISSQSNFYKNCIIVSCGIYPVAPFLPFSFAGPSVCDAKHEAMYVILLLQNYVST